MQPGSYTWQNAARNLRMQLDANGPAVNTLSRLQEIQNEITQKNNQDRFETQKIIQEMMSASRIATSYQSNIEFLKRAVDAKVPIGLDRKNSQTNKV